MLGVGWKEKKKKLFPFWRKEGDYNKVIAAFWDTLDTFFLYFEGLPKS